MAKLTTKERNVLPAKDFAGPGRSYPVNDRRHAANAKARATQAEEAGRISKELENRIDEKADRVLKSKPKRRGVLGKRIDEDHDSDYR